MPFVFKRAAALLATLVLISCGGGTDAPQNPPGSVTFLLRMRDQPESESFRVAIRSPEVIAKARAQLALPADQRRLFINGRLQAGNGGHNTGWSWHLTDANLVELTMELCDGRPSEVERELNYWLTSVKQFCPWSSYVHAEQK